MTTSPTVGPSGPASPAGQPGSLLELFARSVAGHGGRAAVDDGRHRFSYAELDAAATAVAGQLGQAGVRPGDRVACYLERSALTVVALLGVLRAGAAYVAIDTSYPDERRELMLAGSAPAAVVSSTGLAARLGSGRPVLHLDDSPAPAARTIENPPIEPGDPAAVLFTSGSSGRPKPVLLTHANLVHFAGNTGLPALGPQDRMAQVSSVSFDAFHYELWCTLAAGAALVVLPSLRELISADVQRELRRRQISVMLAPTMAVSHVLAEDRQAFNSLRVLTTGGDVLSSGTCRELFEGGFTGEFHNLYGPTEATTAATGYRVGPADGDAGSVPIGRPLPGVIARVLDEDRNPVAAGTVGQLHLGGAGIAAGYLLRPELTAERFWTDPVDGVLHYATGDLARVRPDGLLEFHGRADDQVKVRGYRVELGEVERTLGGHPQVREVAVLASGAGSDKYLVAVVAGYDRLVPRELREWAEQRLPEFEVPSSFVITDAIPANEHGKRDLERLRQLTQAELRRRSAQAEPDGEVQTYLAGLWEELLAVERIGATDDFFDLGGNSLLAFRVQRRINRDLRVALRPKDVLVHSGLRELADLIEKSQQDERERP